MEQQDECKKFILLDKRGKIACLVENEIKYKNFSEIKDKNTIFTFWSANIEELKGFISAFEAFKSISINPFKNLSLDEISFLEMRIDGDGSVVFS